MRRFCRAHVRLTETLAAISLREGWGRAVVCTVMAPGELRYDPGLSMVLRALLPLQADLSKIRSLRKLPPFHSWVISCFAKSWRDYRHFSHWLSRPESEYTALEEICRPGRHVTRTVTASHLAALRM